MESESGSNPSLSASYDPPFCSGSLTQACRLSTSRWSHDFRSTPPCGDLTRGLAAPTRGVSLIDVSASCMQKGSIFGRSFCLRRALRRLRPDCAARDDRGIRSRTHVDDANGHARHSAAASPPMQMRPQPKQRAGIVRSFDVIDRLRRCGGLVAPIYQRLRSIRTISALSRMRSKITSLPSRDTSKLRIAASCARSVSWRFEPA